MNDLMELIERLESETAQLIATIDKVDYEDLAAFSESREQLVQAISQRKDALTEEGKQRLGKLSMHDEAILFRMSHFKTEASTWLSRQGAIKAQKNAYNMKFSPHSFLIDRKK